MGLAARAVADAAGGGAGAGRGPQLLPVRRGQAQADDLKCIQTSRLTDEINEMLIKAAPACLAIALSQRGSSSVGALVCVL